MTEPDEAVLWARERAHEYANPVYWDTIKNGHADHVWGIPEMAKGYRAGQAASAERIKALEEALRRLLAASEPVETYTHEVAVRLEGAVEHAEALLKEADQ